MSLARYSKGEAPDERCVGLVLRWGALGLRRAHDAGTRAWGDVRWAYDPFASHAAGVTVRRLDRASEQGGTDLRTEDAVRGALATVRGADLYLAGACDGQVPPAWETFVARFRGPVLGFLLRRLGAGPDRAAAGADDLLGALALPPPGGGARTRMGTYAGKASLLTWLCAIARNRFLSEAREERRAARLAVGAAAEEVPAPGAPPPDAIEAAEEIAGRAALLERVARALDEALAVLPGRYLAALAYLYRDGLRKQEVGRLLGVAPSRVTRMLGKANDRLRKALAREGLPAADREAGRQDRLFEQVLALLGEAGSSRLTPRDEPGEGLETG
jgi:RNA polymerase sigma factor (sigma-70 family)